MSKSLTISAGDLVLNNRSFSVVSGQDKLFQDLKLTLQEPIGTDPLSPSYGSSLDSEVIGGVDVSPFIGGIFSPQIASAITAEVRRVLQTYQQAQLLKMQQEGQQFRGRTTLDDSEVIYSINSINTTNIGTVVLVQVSLTTLAGATTNLTFPVQV